MIDSGIIARLTLRFKQDAIDYAVKKFEKKIADGSFKNPDNKYGVEAYLESICDGYGKNPKEKAVDYKNYRFENIFEELTREKGEGWFSRAINEMRDVDAVKLKNIKQMAVTSWHYYKVKSSESYGLTAREEKILTDMYIESRKPETSEEKEISDKAIAKSKEIERKALSEAMAVIWEEGYGNLIKQEVTK